MYSAPTSPHPEQGSSAAVGAVAWVVVSSDATIVISGSANEPSLATWLAATGSSDAGASRGAGATGSVNAKGFAARWATKIMPAPPRRKEATVKICLVTGDSFTGAGRLMNEPPSAGSRLRCAKSDDD